MRWLTVYVGAVVAANASVMLFGPVSTPVNAFLLVAFSLTARDALHERWIGRGLVVRMGGLIAFGGAISCLFGAGRIAFASVVAFAVSETVDAVVYHCLRRRSRYVAMVASNGAASVVDSALFVGIAFGAMPLVAVLQIAAKALGGWFWARVLVSVDVTAEAEEV